MDVLNVGIGTQVTDALAPTLRAAGTDITDDGTETGDWVEVVHPCHVAVQLATGTITATAIDLDVEIQGADDDSGTNTVSYGRFAAIDETNDDETRVLEVFSLKRYMRAVVVSSNSNTATACDPVITVETRDYKRESDRTA